MSRLLIDETKRYAQTLAAVTGAQNFTGIDSKNYTQALVHVLVSAYATDPFTVMKVQTSEASDFASGVVDLFELDAAGLTAASAAGRQVGIALDISNAKRYLRVTFTKGTGNATVTATWVLSGAMSSPLTAADKGLNAEFVPA